MTAQEQQLLNELFQRLSQTQGVTKDPQAQATIDRGLGAVPDAAYWLAQRTLLLEHALQQAQQKITQLQQQVEQGAQHADASSFLSGGLSSGMSNGLAGSSGTRFGREPEPGNGYNNFNAQQQFQQPQQASSSWRDRFFGGGAPRVASAAPAYAQAAPAGGSSFLGNAAASVAGVAGGMFLFNGLENLLGNHHSGASGSFGSNSLFGGNNANNGTADGQPAAQENVTQNFYDDSNSGGRDQLARDAGLDSISQSGDGGNFDDNSFFDEDNYA